MFDHNLKELIDVLQERYETFTPDYRDAVIIRFVNEDDQLKLQFLVPQTEIEHGTPPV